MGQTLSQERDTAMQNLSYILMLTTLLVSCSDSGEEALAPVKIGGKVGYINPKGEIVINPQFDEAKNFSEGLARVNIGGRRNRFRRDGGGKWGYINSKGKFVINPQFDEAWDFSK